MRRIEGLIFLFILVYVPSGNAAADVTSNLRKELLPFLPAEISKEPSVLKPEPRRLLADEYLTRPEKRPQPWKKLKARAVEALLEVPIPYTSIRLGKLLDSGGLIDSGIGTGECRPIQLVQRINEYDAYGNRTGERFKLKPRLQAPIPVWGKCAVFGVRKVKSFELGPNGEISSRKTTGAMLTFEVEW